MLRIGQPKSALNKKQQEFNTLIDTIEKTEATIADLHRAFSHLLQRADQELKPLTAEYQTHRVEVVRIMESAYKSDLLRKAYLTKLAYLISENSLDLIRQGVEELIPVFDQYNDISYEALLKQPLESNEETAEEIQEDLPQNSKTAFQDPSNFYEWDEEEQLRWKTEKRRMQAEEQKEAARQILDRHKTSRAVRSIYLDLVKAYHPDLERDENEKLKKTALIQEITAAYQKNNLLELLKMQIVTDHSAEVTLENLTKNELTYYNKALKQQLEYLDNEKVLIQNQLAGLCHIPPQHIQSFNIADIQFNSIVNQAKSEIKNIKHIITVWKDITRLKAYLKTYQIPEN
ncbi:hypothetical protein DYBT9275_01111 [Dyadobacter sp. CECT 9275]|uniref:Molecular chaperone DnaJ n=1 Tax=Dyadobacter helix TaxID=2822344 RepID=A0A916J9P5_9BACT|nr:hypothetical protein DYBT9275_01111 [Dyadobacter sp. CECT 9275]